MSETRQIAEQIVDEHLDEMMSPREYASTAKALIDDFEKALRDRDERAAKKCDDRVIEISNYQTRPYRVARRELESIASAIRGKSNGD